VTVGGGQLVTVIVFSLLDVLADALQNLPLSGGQGKLQSLLKQIKGWFALTLAQ
jgi:hypothetical protein